MTKLLLKCCALIWCIYFAPSVVAQTLIVNPQVSDTQLTRNSARAIFAMRTPQWSDGTPVHVFVLADNHPIHSEFTKQVLGMFPYQLRRIWDRQVFSGTGIAPITVESEQEMLDRVAETKGAIGYIHSNKLNSSVKAIGNPT